MKQVNYKQLIRSILVNHKNDRTRAMTEGFDFRPIEQTYFKVLTLIEMATKEVREPELTLFPTRVLYTDEMQMRDCAESLADDEYQQWLYDMEH